MAHIPPCLRICVDGRMLGSGGTGVSTYAAGLVAATACIGGGGLILRDRDGGRALRWVHAVGSGIRRARPSAADANLLCADNLFRSAQVRFGLFGRFTTVRTDGAPGIMHWTYPVPIRMEGWVNLYTVHDVLPLDHPDLTPVDPRRLRAILAGIVRTADGIITVSEASRTRIIAQLGVDPACVTNCYQVVAPVGRTDEVPPFGLTTGGYLLFCGLTEPRKNVARLLDAHAASGTPLPLVLAGPAAAAADHDLRRSIDLAVREGRVICAGYVAPDVLQDLLRHAAALLFPSLAEGFGLPVIEAMRVGTPVLTADRGALAEIAGGAALLVDPDDVAAIAHGITAIVGDGALRAKLTGAGLRRAARFTQARFAARLRGAYSNALMRNDDRTPGQNGRIAKAISIGK